ncbi:MAG: hypothetical protein ACRDPY_31725 [Streptosporangiaceae bacterium]
MSHQQPPDDPYNQQTRAASFTPNPSGQPAYPPPPQGQQQWYQQQQQQEPPQQQQQYYGSGEAQNAWPQQNQPAAQPGYQVQPATAGYQAQPVTAGYQAQPVQPGYQAPGYQAQAQPGRGGHRQGQVGGKQYALRGAEVFWYILFCIDFGAAYFNKIPVKKAACEVFSELQLDGQGASQGFSLNSAESAWYIVMCLFMGAGYFAKVWAKKSLWEIVNMMRAAPADQIQALTRALTGSGSGSAGQYPQRF